MNQVQRSLATFCLAAATLAGGGAAAQDAADAGVPAPRFGGTPVFTPFTRAPQLLNREEMRRAYLRYYPASLRRSGTGGEVLLWFLLDENGDLLSMRIKQPSGNLEVDAAALHLARQMRFSPAYNRDLPVKLWIQLPVRFAVDPGDAAAAVPPAGSFIGPSSPGAAPYRHMSREPRMAPPHARLDEPTLANERFVLRQLEAQYRARFPGGGPNGAATLDLRIDSGGNAEGALRSSSRVPALDSLALGIVPRLVFVPALKSGTWSASSSTLKVRFPPEVPR